jgi:predicted NAD/FAD-dependent oxidoreductase
LLTDKTQQLILAGDWSLGGRVENAYLAGQQAAAILLP